MSNANNTWKATGSVSAEALLPARLQAHIAAHVVAGPAKILATPEDDYGHVALTWRAEAESGALVTRNLSGDFACALNIRTMEISIESSRDIDPIALNRCTLADAKAWINNQVEISHGMKPTDTIPEPGEWPDHAVAQGGPFDCSDTSAFEELDRHFNNAAFALQTITEREPHATPVRTWPHHFDTATLVSLDPGLDPEKARSINVGLSPGDGQFAEPYWYVVPYPDPKRTTMLSLPDDGFWHLEGWTGAILKATSYSNIKSSAQQRDDVAGFLNAAYDACRSVLEEGSEG